MSEFLVLYRADQATAEQMAQATPEQLEAGMQAWMAWFEQSGDAVVDMGSQVFGGDGTIGGFSILQADSALALTQVLEGHPHAQVGTIEVLEFLPMPGM